MELELSDSKLIAAALAAARTSIKQAKDGLRASTPQKRIRGREMRRCQCGVCTSCIDNARWDRIFREKFADPNYYKSRPIPHQSSLGWLGDV